MKYRIYSLEYPDHLKEISHDGMGLKTISRAVIEHVTLNHTGEYQKPEDAIADIKRNAEQLKHHEFILLPIISVDDNGNVSL